MEPEEEADEREEREKKGAGAVPWMARARGPATGWPGSPLEGARSALRYLLDAPGAFALRVALGAAVSLHAAWFAYAAWSRGEGAAAASRSVAFPRSVDVKDAAGMWVGLRPAMSSLVTGLRNIADPDGAVERARRAARAAPAAEGAKAGESPAPAGAASAAKARLDSGSPAGGEKRPEGEDSAGERLAGGLSGLGAGGGGGQATSAAVGAAPPQAAAAGGAPGAAEASKRAMQAAGGRTLGRASSSKSALGQLRFADKHSSLGKGGATAEQSFQAADAAFQGQTAGPGGSAIGGAGAGTEGGGVGAGGSPAASSPIRQSPQQRYSCPSGYYLKGESCVPIQSENKTPYQGLAEKAKVFLMMAAALALVGIFLLTQPSGIAHIIGGLLIGAAIALAVAAVAMGNKIGGEYGQKTQEQAIESAGQKAAQGQAP